MIRLVVAFMIFALPAAAEAEDCPIVKSASDSLPSLQRPASGEIQKPYGMVTHPLLMVSRLHTGVDFAGDKGDSVVAAATGIVREAERDAGYGKLVILDHGAGWETAYAHLDRIDVVKGACIAKGGRIGSEGSTGLSTGPHLHFEVRHDGRPIDPAPLLPTLGR
jgi:murein DD-endopeptidase MepM/ murein hydrolase activator NlpD